MKRLVMIVLCAGAVGATSGCEEGASGDPLTCETLAPPDNCWRDSVSEAYACIDESLENGTFNADRTVCTWSDGTTATFATAVPADPDFDYVWDITIASGGGQCARYVSDDNSNTLTTASGTTRFGSSGASVSLTCPDDSTFVSSDPFALLSCDGDVDLPGHGWASSLQLSFSLLASPEGRFGWINCE